MFKYEGWYVPNVRVQILTAASRYILSTTELFANKTVVVFAVPGAFTCPYSTIQLLGYNEYAEAFRDNGVDQIYCISVNDPFSLAAWAREEGATEVSFIPDMNGDFTRAMGMTVNLSDRGMGLRSQRYSMLVKDCLIQKIFVEKEDFETMPVVSDAETLLDYINPEARKPEQTAVMLQMWQAMLSN